MLHHLKSPSVGMNILKDNLVEHGGMGLMVYASYGRTAVYQMQNLMKMVNSNVNDLQNKIVHSRSIINFLPERNWFIANPLAVEYKYGNSIMDLE